MDGPQVGAVPGPQQDHRAGAHLDDLVLLPACGAGEEDRQGALHGWGDGTRPHASFACLRLYSCMRHLLVSVARIRRVEEGTTYQCRGKIGISSASWPPGSITTEGPQKLPSQHRATLLPPRKHMANLSSAWDTQIQRAGVGLPEWL